MRKNRHHVFKTRKGEYMFQVRVWDVSKNNHHVFFKTRKGEDMLHVRRISFMSYFFGYDEVNVRVHIDGWHKQVMQLYPYLA